MSLTNPNSVVTEERLSDFYQGILPYLGGMPDILANKFDKSDLYSTDEKIVGRWIDGKPLYQKTWTGLSITVSNSWVNLCTISDVESIINISTRDNGQIQNMEYAKLNNNTVQVLVADSKFAHGITEATIQYTKTTDSPVEIGIDTDYSTTEKIVGTWIDGSPIYEKTFVSENNSFTNTTHFEIPYVNQIIGVVDVRRPTIQSGQYMTGYASVAGAGTASAYVMAGAVMGGSTSGAFASATSVTFRYTKASS